MRIPTSRRGFTLFEVMLSLVIIAILAGIIFEITNASIQAVGAISGEQLRRRQVVSLMEVFRRNFDGLAPQAVLTLDVRPSAEKYLSEIQIENSPSAFSFGKRAWYFGWTILGLEVAKDGTLQLGIRQLDRDQTVRDREGARWMPLIDKLQVFEWNFYDSQARRWVGKWENREARPSLIRLRFQVQGDPNPDDVTFSLPWTKPIAGQPLP